MPRIGYGLWNPSFHPSRKCMQLRGESFKKRNYHLLPVFSTGSSGTSHRGFACCCANFWTNQHTKPLLGDNKTLVQKAEVRCVILSNSRDVSKHSGGNSTAFISLNVPYLPLSTVVFGMRLAYLQYHWVRATLIRPYWHQSSPIIANLFPQKCQALVPVELFKFYKPLPLTDNIKADFDTQ